MVILGTKQDMIDLLQLYLEAARRGDFSQLCVVAYGREEYCKDGVVEPVSPTTSLIGTLDILKSEVKELVKEVEGRVKDTEQALLDSVDTSKPQ